MPDRSVLVLPARLESLPEFMDLVRQFFVSHRFSPEKIGKIQLATEEALVNIFRYAYPEEGGPAELICRKEGEDRFLLEIIDQGLPFNPLTRPDPDITVDLEHRKIGGLGILLLKTLVEEVYYERIADRNRLTLVVHKARNPLC
ncbi:MAG: ATP-binding protein [Thermodesulfobacteriota bacterium]